MGRIADLLDAIDVTKENTEELYSIFRMIPDFELPVIRFYLYKGAVLIRQRINIKGEEFDKVSELGYPPAIYVRGYERANVPFQPMFYACCFPGDNRTDDDPPPRVVALMETSPFYKNKSEWGIERSTVSRWDLEKDVELIAMPFMADYSRACQMVNTIKEEWNREITKYNVNQDGLDLIMYMAKEIGKDFKSNLEYFKIANFVNYILNVNEKTKNADGVIYPTVPGAGAGFNVAIKPSVVDNKVRFVGASLCHLLKRGEKAYQCVMNHTDSVENGIITYKDKYIDPQEAAIYANYAEGLSLRN